jgi:tetratricopeptide (TPR) repeat protein
MESPASTVEDLLRLAREDLARNSVSTAEKSLEQVIVQNNQIPEAFYLLGHVYTRKGKFKKAILSFERALKLDPFHTEAAIALSSLYNDVGKYKEGAQVFYKTKKRLDRTLPGHDPRINQSLAKRHYELGLLYMRFERFQEAHHEFLKTFNLDPENVLGAVQMAKCLSKLGDKEAAINLLRKALQDNPRSVEARIQLGILLHAQQRVKDAYREWQEALSVDPDNKSALMYLGMFDGEPLQNDSSPA